MAWHGLLLAPVPQWCELVEQVPRVVRPWCGLRVVLDGEGGPVEQADALDHAVVQVHVGDLGGTVGRAERRSNSWGDAPPGSPRVRGRYPPPRLPPGPR